ncbi:MAG TPA: beta-galactosidase trimerization domain-containing protein [Bryobacteraceae bacterium]|nr:beta-galactosidase trimerization domain-containing protein [Bryobacteraceae bacterium]
MNRRRFLAANLAAALTPRTVTAEPAAAADVPPAPPVRAQWIENGIIDAGGNHEPYSFVVRRGGQPLDAYDRYQRAQSEELILRLKSQGVEVFHTHLYKGAGMAHEKAEMEDAKRVAALAHRHGLRVDSYVQWNTMLYETFFAEEPRAKNWVQRDEAGIPIKLVYGYQQSFRYRPCFANQEYLDYLKRIVRFAVEEVKTDLIHFDNFSVNPEPDSCHCECCAQGFRNFLRKKYSPAKRKDRFGFENVDYVNPPSWNAENPPERLEIIFDPAIQEWIDFRCQVMANALGQMAALAKSLNPEVVIEINPHGITGGNRAWEAGLDHARLLKHTQVFWSEEGNPPDYTPDGRLVSTIRSYKLARRYDNVLFTYIFGDERAMAESLAFNQTLGYVGNDPLSPDLLRYIGFYRANRGLYQGTVDAGNVAVLRSYASITYHNARAQLSAILLEQALIRARIPFDLVFDEHLQDLSKYRVLALPDTECLSDEQLTAVRRFVDNGGGLIATGLAGMYDQWRRLRIKRGLEGLIDSQPVAKDYEEQVERQEAHAEAVRKEYGKGRVVYFAAVPFDGPLPEMAKYFEIGNKFWKAPKNWSEIAGAVRWAARGEIPVEIGGPPFLVANLAAQPEKRRMLLHLVNYGRNRAEQIKSVKVDCRLPAGTALKEISVISPDAGGPQTLKFRQSPDGVGFTIPAIKVYSVAVLSW